MAVKQVVVSDISGAEVSDQEHARIVVKNYPTLDGTAVELDVSTEEAGKLQASELELVTIVIHEPDAQSREVVLEAKAFAKAFPGVDLEDILSSARAATPARSDSGATTRRRRSSSGSGSSAPKTDKLDYTDPEHFGKLHRGRVTEEEARLVRDDMQRASKNRQAQGHPPIDFGDAKEIKRYGL